MSKILIEGNKVIIDGHANDLDTCNTLTNLCDELSTSEKFRTIKYESGYGEFESVSENEEKKFASDYLSIYLYSNDGTKLLVHDEPYAYDDLVVVSDGIIIREYYNSSNMRRIYTYSGSKKFIGISRTAGTTSADFLVGSSNRLDRVLGDTGAYNLYIVEANLGYQVNVKSNDGTTTLAQNATVDSVVVTSTGAQLKCGDTVNATYTYAGSKLFAGLATSVNATAPKYKPGDTIEITAETTLYIVENIIIPEHHNSLNELFTNIAAVIREKTGDEGVIPAVEFPNMIRNKLEVIPALPYLTFRSPNSFTLKVNDTTKHWDGTLEYSTDASTWSTWDGTTTLSSATSGSDNVLYLRGTGNTVITGKDYNRGWAFTGSNISCIGNIENLLDYATVKAGGHPTMATYCYQNIFRNCNSLTKPPALPATTLASNCYSGMFFGCGGLTKPPALPATTLAENCYRSMFYGCTKIKLSSTQTGEYTVAYRIPSSGTGTTATDALFNMFASTGGDFTGTPQINTTYYLSNTNTVVS